MLVTIKRLLCLMTVLAALTPVCAQEQSMQIRCEMSMPKTLQGAQAAELAFTLTNAGADAIQVLNWQTPFEGIKAPMFTVTRDGASVEYMGPMLKRGTPRKESYLVLKPGERQQATINLADGWDVAAPGRYTIKYSAQLFDVMAGSVPAPRSLDEFKPFTLSCNSVVFTRLR
jgi:peptidyl-Lys metalloendopeptidase